MDIKIISIFSSVSDNKYFLLLQCRSTLASAKNLTLSYMEKECILHILVNYSELGKVKQCHIRLDYNKFQIKGVKSIVSHLSWPCYIWKHFFHSPSLPLLLLTDHHYGRVNKKVHLPAFLVESYGWNLISVYYLEHETSNGEIRPSKICCIMVYHLRRSMGS